VFRLADATGLRNIVQVMNAEEMKPGAKTLLGLEEQNAGLPVATHQWFYAGDVAGVEFVHR
jgi:hypothetical protein